MAPYLKPIKTHIRNTVGLQCRTLQYTSYLPCHIITQNLCKQTLNTCLSEITIQNVFLKKLDCGKSEQTQTWKLQSMPHKGIPRELIISTYNMLPCHITHCTGQS